MPEKESLNQTQKRYMYNAGFLLHEINAFAHAVTPDGKKMQDFNFMAEVFQDMIKTRIEYVRKLKAQGWNDMQVRQRVNMLYATKRGKASPWDFLKIEYKPGVAISDNMWATMLKAKTRIAQKLGAGYAKPMRKEMRPRFEAKVRNLPPQP
jgi:hypothetical protein